MKTKPNTSSHIVAIVAKAIASGRSLQSSITPYPLSLLLAAIHFLGVLKLTLPKDDVTRITLRYLRLGALRAGRRG